MRKVCLFALVVLWVTSSLCAQGKRLWVLRAPGEMVEYDVTTFAVKQRVKVPPEALKAAASLSVNRAGQILFAQSVTLPLSEEEIAAASKIWIWNGHAATSLDQSVQHKVEDRGSNHVVMESAPVPYLAADGAHLCWFANEMRRLQREEIDLSTSVTWQAWQSDVSGGGRAEVATMKIPDCRCTTGSCEESCPMGVVWAPETGVDNFFLVTQFVAGQTASVYKASTLYRESAGKWTAVELVNPLQRVLDAASAGDVIVEAIPDAGCCGWSNQSNDQTMALIKGKTLTLFDEQATYKNPDYDVSFYTANAKLSPDLGFVAMTITATAQSDKPIQLAEDGQANPEESQRIRKELADLPAVAVKSVEDSPRQTAFVSHAVLVGWISEKELLIVEGHLLVFYNVGTGARRKSSVRVEDAGRVFLR
jgi:hypothetical protein